MSASNPDRTCLARFAARPDRAFVIFLTLHAIVWILLPAVLYPNLPLDLIEALTYGREWQLGYDKLPPLPWWMVEVMYRAIGQDIAYYLLAQAAVVTAMAMVYTTARRIAGPLAALAAVLIIDGLHYFNFTAAKFNHDVIQLPFWALAGYSLHRALRDGRIVHWLLFGIAIGISLWAKYFVVVLAVPIALFLLIDRDARKSLTTSGPWFAAAVALAIMAPHLIWLVRNDFLPFAYAAQRAAPSLGVIGHIWHPAQFTLYQLGFMIPALLIALPLFARRGETADKPSADAFDRRIVTLLAFGPGVTVLAMSAVTGRGTIAMWGYPLWLFLGLWLVLNARHALDAPCFSRLARIWCAVFVLFAAAFAASYAVLPRFDHRYRAVFYPGSALAAEVTQRFRAITGQPLAYVIGSMWEGGNIAHYSSDHPRVLIDGKPVRAPWIDLADLKRKGAVIVWENSDPATIPAEFAAHASGAVVQPPLSIPHRKGDQILKTGWAILKPSR